MKKIFLLKLITIYIVSILCSCSKNKEVEEIITDEEYETLTTIDGIMYNICNTEVINSSSGTICCISGPLEAEVNDIIQFEYSGNLEGEVEVTWEVISGELLLKNTNLNVATFEVQEGFNGGSILSLGTSNSYVCSEAIEITLIN
ncbi:hypothetical protein [Maribacter sp. IgM3_T14_3]|uniref:hypothetical protein n=1 Tax=Maribacter sp. IgM3_T14_3 TaxID=3415140 RepID=UPI003C6F1856